MTFKIRDRAKDEGEHEHGEDGPNDRPSNPDDSLFVSNREVAPCEDLEKFPVAPEIAPVVFFSPSGFKDSLHVCEMKFGELRKGPLSITLRRLSLKLEHCESNNEREIGCSSKI